MAQAAQRQVVKPEEIEEIEPPSVVRTSMPDLAQHADWLLWRLKDRYPHLEAKMLMGWLRGAIEDNESMFIRCGRAIGLAQIKQHPLDAHKIVEEVFVLVRGRDTDGVIEKDAIAEGASLYGAFKSWADRLGAAEIIVERNSDVPRELIKEALGRIFIREIVYAKTVK